MYSYKRSIRKDLLEKSMGTGKAVRQELVDA